LLGVCRSADRVSIASIGREVDGWTEEPNVMTRKWQMFAVLLSLGWGCAHADGLDHELPLDQSGIWARKYSLGLEYGVIATEVAGALVLGNDDELGHTFWQTIDSSTISGAVAGILKYTTGRARPYQGNNPNKWFQGSKYQSFPSGEVTLQASFVTPFIVNYGREQPLILLLEALPLYDADARLKAQAHWQTDVIAAWVIGTGLGYWTTTYKTPFFVRILPGGVSAGFYKEF
jgi:PAP2 superfamily protein